MNLDDFEEGVDEAILDHGWCYYEDDHIKSIVDDEGSGRHRAVVSGSRDYNVMDPAPKGA
ncbi:MAG: hypothetical protein M0Z41_04800 [Peptococcaceae bacterium]|jgi:hypothetical protein|nr:hypothetical protein [Peptococcaceae bacterium]